MRVIVTFFLSLGLLLFVESDHVYARQQNAIFAPAQYTENLPQQEFERADYDLFVIKNSHFFDQQENMIDLEDDDSEISSKSIIISRLSKTAKIVPVEVLHQPEVSLPFCDHLSYSCPNKYILQRVIRI